MPKKKKKSRNSSRNGGGGDVGRSPDPSSSPLAATATATGTNLTTDLDESTTLDDPVVDCLSLRLQQISSSSTVASKTLKYSPILLLHEADACSLDVETGDSVLVISATTSGVDDDKNAITTTTTTTANACTSEKLLDNDEWRVHRTAVTTVKIVHNDDDGNDMSSSKKSPRIVGRTSGGKTKKSHLGKGCCSLFPSVLLQSFLDLGDDDDDETQQSIQAATHVTPARTPTMPSTPTSSTSNSSSSKSKFSFARGGGGDVLISPRGSTTTPSKAKQLQHAQNQRRREKKMDVWIVPMDSDLGEALASILCHNATSLRVCTVTMDNQHEDNNNKHEDNNNNNHMVQTQRPSPKQIPTGPLVQRLLQAHTVGAHVSHETIFSISFRGQMMRLKVIIDPVVTTTSTTTTRMSRRKVLDDTITAVVPPSYLRLTSAVTESNTTTSTTTSTIFDDNDHNVEDPLVTSFDRLSLRSVDRDSSLLQRSIRKALQKAQSDDKPNSLMLYRVTRETQFIVAANKENSDANDSRGTEREIISPFPTKKRPSKLVVGLDATLQQVQSALETPLRFPKLFGSSKLKPPKGILLHGPSGTGKSSLAQQIVQSMEYASPSSSSSYHVESIHCTALQSQTAFVGQAETLLVRLFEKAQKPRRGKAGCLIVLDDIHLICPRRQGTNLGADRLASTLLALLDGLEGNQNSTSSYYYPTVILAIATNPAALDPALRRPGRLDAEIEVPLPDEPVIRSEILQFHIDSLGAHVTDISEPSQWLSLARLAKGFTGADLKLAVKEALRNALLANNAKEVADAVVGKNHRLQVHVKDLVAAIRSTKPSAIKSVSVEVPRVPWSSIGGMDYVKEQLREAIELPMTHGEVFAKLGIRPPRGVLLYGPPGCSKTLMARALATEGHMNFLAVKGPELLSKWLGESERALAALFRRARLASPAVIFFDEVDAIASKRGGGSGGGGGERLLSQLLTELDGIQSGTGGSLGSGGGGSRVVIVCATNRPDLLDGALMRPGRIDRMIYVGVPDQSSREGILRIGLKGKSCSDDVDISALVDEKFSGGLSGAELIAACRDAALLAMEDYEEEENADMNPKIRMAHLVQALTGMERQITPSMLDFYASFQGTPRTQ